MVGCANSMTSGRIAELRAQSRDLFYHGYDNYMAHAFPEDELRPISCSPLVRVGSADGGDYGINDVLGNYSLTLIDSLSTLAILASVPKYERDAGHKALLEFQHGVQLLVEQYGDGTRGISGQGQRARGFDLDSKVQVFETVIRGVGGLLSAHLFAIGELPISGYEPQQEASCQWHQQAETMCSPIQWSGGFRYDGQLLRLALDLAERLLPAFYTRTGLPYPRVNLRTGIPFFPNSPLNHGNAQDESACLPSNERTETCSAGAGSLVLEFTVLSRLSADPRFEQLGKRAFWAVWQRRSNLNLVGSGLDAESGKWVSEFSTIGAGVDSFFEYAFKTYILLSGQELPNTTITYGEDEFLWNDPNTLHPSLTDYENSPEAFLLIWQNSYLAIKKHLYDEDGHAHYANVARGTGYQVTAWIDSLAAFYPGLLAIAGKLDEAIKTHLVYTALWTRYSALPERWSYKDTSVEHNMGHWPGRPEFIESNYHIFRATQDPWYLHVGEMVLEDIQKRCWTECGWAGLANVVSGEKADRMESFFLGETAKYLYLLFDPDHPLNNIDASYVFTTEGHPLILPRASTPISTSLILSPQDDEISPETCEAPPSMLPFSMSATAARQDLFSAAEFVKLPQVEEKSAHLRHANEDSDLSHLTLRNSNGGMSYPRTLPLAFVPTDGFCTVAPSRMVFNLEFPTNPAALLGITAGVHAQLKQSNVQRFEGQSVLLKALPGTKMSLIEDDTPHLTTAGRISTTSWRIQSFAGGYVPLSRYETVYVDRSIVLGMTDPSFTCIKNPVMLDLILQLEDIVFRQSSRNDNNDSALFPKEAGPQQTCQDSHIDVVAREGEHLTGSTADLFAGFREQSSNAFFSAVYSQFPSLRPSAALTSSEPSETDHHYQYLTLPATTPTGIGAAVLPDFPEAPNVMLPDMLGKDDALSFTTLYFGGQACNARLPDEAVRKHQLIVLRRGGCSFSRKLANIPPFIPAPPGKGGLQLVIVVSDEKTDGLGDDNGSEDETENSALTRPLLDEIQRTSTGLVRHHEIPMVLVGGGEPAYEMLKTVKSVGLRRRYNVESRGRLIRNLEVV